MRRSSLERRAFIGGAGGGVVGECAQRGGAFGVVAESAGVTAFERRPTDHVCQAERLVCERGQHRRRGEFDLAAQVMDGCQSLSGGALQVPEQ